MKDGAATGTKIILPRGIRTVSGKVTLPVTATISALPFLNSSVLTGVITLILCFGKNLMYSKKRECEIETKVFGTIILITADSLLAFCSIFSKISSYRPSISSTKGKISSPISVKRKGRDLRSKRGTFSLFPACLECGKFPLNRARIVQQFCEYCLNYEGLGIISKPEFDPKLSFGNLRI